MIYCPCEFNETLPHSVSLSIRSRGNVKNVMKIIDNQPLNGVKKKFVVCTKPLDLKEGINPIQFIEWIETLKILGAEQIYMYHRYFDPKIFKIAKYYEEKGFLVLEQYLEPSGVSRASTHCYESRINELPIWNDCFYRVRNLYEYVVAIDPDEILIPVQEKDKTWNDLIKSSGSNKTVDAYAFRSVTYSSQLEVNDKVPTYYYMLQHVQVRR